jgi:uncharacterized protein
MRLELASEEAPALRPVDASPPPRPRKPKSRLKTIYLRQLHTWHWVSAAVSLVGMMLFAITGITLNHAASIGAEPVVTPLQGTLPVTLVRSLEPAPASSTAPLPLPVATRIKDVIGLDPIGKPGEWSADEVYVSLPRPGGDAWVTVGRQSGAISGEITDRGWVSYFNDLHKGRNSGTAWFWFIDVFAGACVLFTITGLLLLQLHARNRRSTWPLVGLGLLIPALIAILFIH